MTYTPLLNLDNEGEVCSEGVNTFHLHVISMELDSLWGEKHVVTRSFRSRPVIEIGQFR